MLKFYYFLYYVFILRLEMSMSSKTLMAYKRLKYDMKNLPSFVLQVTNIKFIHH